MENVPKAESEAVARVRKAFDAIGRASTDTFRQADDEKFAESMDRWLANGGAAKLAAALAKRAGRGHAA